MSHSNPGKHGYSIFIPYSGHMKIVSQSCIQEYLKRRRKQLEHGKYFTFSHSDRLSANKEFDILVGNHYMKMSTKKIISQNYH